jgi:hypothetical protein
LIYPSILFVNIIDNQEWVIHVTRTSRIFGAVDYKICTTVVV